MTIAEKIQYAADKKVVTFFKEGLFYKCYNEDAMVFTKKVRAYKVKVKYVKNVGSKVLSLGFPISEIEKENLKLQSPRCRRFVIGGLLGKSKKNR